MCDPRHDAKFLKYLKSFSLASIHSPSHRLNGQMIHRFFYVFLLHIASFTKCYSENNEHRARSPERRNRFEVEALIIKLNNFSKNYSSLLKSKSQHTMVVRLLNIVILGYQTIFDLNTPTAGDMYVSTVTCQT